MQFVLDASATLARLAADEDLPMAAARALEVLRLLPVELEPPEVDLASSSVLGVAQQFGLSMHEAAYLELAKRRRLPLLTLYEGLRREARKGRVKLV
jgi:predicted nucleic acid-binding protein